MSHDKESARNRRLAKDLAWGLTAEESDQQWEKRERIVEEARMFREKQQKIINFLLQVCADEGLTVSETEEMLLRAKEQINQMARGAKISDISNRS